jgi:3-hydroxybutyryl-CoA dehydrogenase
MQSSEVAVVGTGIMGSGIALACAKGGHTVKLWDIQKEAINQALSKLSSALDTLIASNILTKEEASLCLERIRPEEQVSQAATDQSSQERARLEDRKGILRLF